MAVSITNKKAGRKKGCVPWNKGKKGLQVAWNKGKKYGLGRRLPNCVDCGKKTKSPYAKRCFSCFYKHNMGENHWNWKNTGTKRHRLMGQKEYIWWRSEVFERDLYTCQKCKKKGVYLMAHHIKAWAKYPELRYVVSNGITFCRGCHAKNDRFYARFYRRRVEI